MDKEILEIKNLKMLHFYGLDHEPYIGLNIVYDDNKNLNYDYNYKYFNAYLNKVLEVYKNEYKNNNIQFLEPASKDMMNKLLENNPYIQKEYISKDTNYLSRKTDVLFTFEYIKRAISNLLNTLNEEKNIKVNDIRGYRDRYIVEYSNGDKIAYLPVIIIKQSDKTYNVKFNYPFLNEMTTFNGEINLYNECIAYTYESKNAIYGKNIYDINDKNQELIKYSGSIISYNEPNEEVDNEIIDNYLNMLNLPLLDKRIKTVDNNYLLVGNTDSNTYYSIYLSLSKNYSNVKVTRKYGIIRDKRYVLLDEQKIDINIYLKDNHLVIEKHYLNIEQDNYEYLEYDIDSDDLTNNFNIQKNKEKKK